MAKPVSWATIERRQRQQAVKQLNDWIGKAVKWRTPDEFRQELKKLPGVYSRESVLKELVLIRLLEVLTDVPAKKKRPLSGYQRHVQREVRKGKSLAEAAASWRRVA